MTFIKVDLPTLVCPTSATVPRTHGCRVAPPFCLSILSSFFQKRNAIPEQSFGRSQSQFPGSAHPNNPPLPFQVRPHSCQARQQVFTGPILPGCEHSWSPALCAKISKIKLVRSMILQRNFLNVFAALERVRRQNSSAHFIILNKCKNLFHFPSSIRFGIGHFLSFWVKR